MKRKVLIIEKSEAISFLLRTVLQKQYRIVSDRNCISGMASLQMGATDAIILSVDDIQDINYDFLRHVRSSYLFLSIPVFVVTNNHSPEFRAHLKNLGVTEVLLKPFDPLYLQKRVQEAIQESEFAFSNVSLNFSNVEMGSLKVSI
ncbi:MAG: response regulator [Chitinophagaceae bacterium]|nr:response regulator [Chitinophagaceae bacterium]MBN8667734.1 response regulator [Chitinophagales bacterium]